MFPYLPVLVYDFLIRIQIILLGLGLGLGFFGFHWIHSLLTNAIGHVVASVDRLWLPLGKLATLHLKLLLERADGVLLLCEDAWPLKDEADRAGVGDPATEAVPVLGIFFLQP